MLHTSRRNTFLCPLHTEITKIRGKRNIIDHNFIKGFKDDLVDLDSPFANRIIVFLLKLVKKTATMSIPNVIIDKNNFRTMVFV